MGLKTVDFRPRHLSFDVEMLNDVQASLGGHRAKVRGGTQRDGSKDCWLSIPS